MTPTYDQILKSEWHRRQCKDCGGNCIMLKMNDSDWEYAIALVAAELESESPLPGVEGKPKEEVS